MDSWLVVFFSWRYAYQNAKWHGDQKLKYRKVVNYFQPAVRKTVYDPEIIALRATVIK